MAFIAPQSDTIAPIPFTKGEPAATSGELVAPELQSIKEAVASGRITREKGERDVQKILDGSETLTGLKQDAAFDAISFIGEAEAAGGGFIAPASDVAGGGFIAPASEVAPAATGSTEDSFFKTEVAGVPLDFAAPLRLFETFPELASRLSRGDSVSEAWMGTADYIAGVRPSAIDEESAKLAGTFTQEEPVAQAATAALNAIAKLGGVPSPAEGGMILGPLELARQALIAKKPAAKAVTEVAEATKAIPAGQLDFGFERQAELPFGAEAKTIDPTPSPAEMQAEAARLMQQEKNQQELFTAKNTGADQLMLELGDEAEVFMKRGMSDETGAEVGERSFIDPEVATVADVVNKVDPSPILSKTNRVIAVTGGKSITPLRIAGKSSPAMKRIADLMAGGVDNLTRGFQHDHWRASGKFITRLNDATQKVQRFAGGVNRKISEDIVRGLRGGATKYVKEAAAIRGLLDDFHTYMKDAGIDVGFQKDFFPRKYNIDLLKTDKGRAAFIRDLGDAGIPLERAVSAHDTIVTNGGFLELSIDRSGRMGGAPAVASSLRGRTLDVPDEVLSPYLRSDNMYTVLRDYLEHGTRVAEYTRRFGKNESELNRLMAEASQELGAQGKNIEEVRQHTYDLADTLVHSYNRLPPNSVMGMVNKTVVPTMQVLTLPLATVASLTEPIMVLGRASLRPTSALRALPAVMNHVIRASIRTAFKGVEKADATRAIEELGVGLDAAMAERLQAISQGDTSVLSSLFFKANFLHQWTRFVMTAANETGKQMIKGHLKELAKGTSSKKQVALSKDLIALGVDPKAGVAWVKRGADEADEFFQEAVKGGGQRFTTDVVMIPRSTELPLWHSNPRVKLIAQLKSFPTMFGNTVMKNWYQQIANGTPKQKLGVAAVGTAATIGGMATTSLSDYIRYGEDGNPHKDDWEPYEHVMAGVEKFGGFGMASVGRDALMSSQFGKDATTVAAGPAASKLVDVLAIPAKKDKPKAIARVLASNLSFVSVNKEVKDNVASAIEDALREFE